MMTTKPEPLILEETRTGSGVVWSVFIRRPGKKVLLWNHVGYVDGPMDFKSLQNLIDAVNQHVQEGVP